MPPPTEVIGLCRFSYPALGGFQRRHDTPEDRARYLYAPARLEERFRLFETVTLPSLRAQTDPDFTFLVVIGTEFPQRDRLEALLADLPQAVIRAFPPGRHRDVMARAITEVRRPGLRFSLQFRLDDDDGVGCRFVERLRRTVHEAQPIFERNRRVAIDFNRGHVMRASAAGIHALPVTRAYWTPGLAVALQQDCRQTVMNFGHQELWKHMPALTMTDPDMFIRGINHHNDSELRIRDPLPLLDTQMASAFHAAYGVSAAHVRAVYDPAAQHA
ncbi:MAG: putative rhamnosyl transferase [Rhodobacteraceae bacterium]|nr:putative rhamnosyl transferase [Paracoccaceae bacterium]